MIVPAWQELAGKTAIPLGCVLQPLAEVLPSEVPVPKVRNHTRRKIESARTNELHAHTHTCECIAHHLLTRVKVDMSRFGGPVRCYRCKAYINPHCTFIDGGRAFNCNFCGFTNKVGCLCVYRAGVGLMLRGRCPTTTSPTWMGAVCVVICRSAPSSPSAPSISSQRCVGHALFEGANRLNKKMGLKKGMGVVSRTRPLVRGAKCLSFPRAMCTQAEYCQRPPQPAHFLLLIEKTDVACEIGIVREVARALDTILESDLANFHNGHARVGVMTYDQVRLLRRRALARCLSRARLTNLCAGGAILLSTGRGGLLPNARRRRP